jgi:hypothetical protein
VRNVNPDDLDHLANVIDGRDGMGSKLDEAFTRASTLGISGKLTPLKPMRSWVKETAPDMRTRSALVRLDNGDPQAGLRWAGFSAKDLAKGGVICATPGILFLANAVATSGDPKAGALRRRSNESLDDWTDRLKAHAFASIPALQPYGKEIAEGLGTLGDVTSTVSHGGRAIFNGVNLTKVLVGNSIANGGWARAVKLRSATFLSGLSGYRFVPNAVGVWGNRLQQMPPTIRSLAAPGTWLPGKLGALASGSTMYRNASGIPFASGQVADQWGRISDYVRRSGALTTRIPLLGVTGNQAIESFVGSDKVARMYGGLTHSGQIPARAGQASLLKVSKNAFKDGRLLGKGRLASFGSGAKFAGRASGFIRTAGVLGGAASTAYSGANLWAQGNPKKHFDTREHGAKYVADAAEVGFNASLTAATVAPNPFTIGAMAVTGGVYAGAKVVEHWDGIKKGAGQAWDATGNAAREVAKDPIGSAKKVGHALNPMNW